MIKVVLTFGVMSGVIAILMMAATIPFLDRLPFEYLMALAYTIFFVAFLLVFFGMRSYRRNVGQGTITFGRAFTVGILITLTSCAIYVISWEIISGNFMPDVLVKYGNSVLERERAAGATPEQLNVLMQENQQFVEMYKNPFIRVASSLMEAFPVGLMITVMSAFVLKRKQPGPDTARAAR